MRVLLAAYPKLSYGLAASMHVISYSRRREFLQNSDHGFTDEEIMDIFQTAALFNYSNRVASALDLRPNREYHSMARGGSADKL